MGKRLSGKLRKGRRDRRTAAKKGPIKRHKVAVERSKKAKKRKYNPA